MSTICGKINASLGRNCAYPLQGGTRDRAWIINFADFSVSYAVDGETVEDFALASGATAFYIDGKNNSIEPTFTEVEQTYANMFDHMVKMKGFDLSPEAKAQFNSMKDGRFIVITENYYRGTNGNAAFEVYGLTTGLELTALTRNPNDDATQGAFDFTLSTKKNKEPKVPNTVFITDYSTTKAMIEALL
jgi:hypothetical protein